jgi:predicted permease
MVAVLGYQYWQRRFGGSRGVLGRVVYYDGQPVTIVGVTAPSFSGLEVGLPIDITLPITAAAERTFRERGARFFTYVGRLAPFVTAEQAQSDLDRIFQSFQADAQGVSEPAKPVERVRLVDAARGKGRFRTQLGRPILVLLTLMAAVLAIACANVANLLFARGSARERELAVRAAIGANRLRLVRLLVTETLVLFAIGALIGALLANAVARGIAAFLAIGRIPIVLDVGVDARALAVTGGLCLLAAILAGLIPALRASGAVTSEHARFGPALRGASRSSLPVMRWLVVFQLAVSIVILVGGSLLVRTLRNLEALDAGFRPAGVLTLSVQPVGASPPVTALARLWTEVLGAIDRLPGVETASLSVLTPLSGRDTPHPVEVRGPHARSAADREVRVNFVSHGYLETFGIALRAGRSFTARDAAGAPRVAIINEAAARFYFGDSNPLGSQVRFDSAGTKLAYEVVGIVRDVKHKTLREPATRFVYVPVPQAFERLDRLTLSVHTRRRPLAMVAAIRRELQSIDRQLLVSDVLTMERQIDQALLRERLLSTLSTLFAALGLLLASIGLYGLASYSVVRRRTEIGIRMALGATPRAIRALMLRDAVGMVAFGAAIGLPVSLFAARGIRNLLYGVSTADPMTIAACVGVLGIVAAVAAYMPARHASRIEPTLTLRAE